MTADPSRVLPRVQAAEVTYELHTLGWKAFQGLCVTIAGEVWGQTVQSYFDSHDGGRDGAFHGTWKANDGEAFVGSFTMQCKFTAKTNKQLQLNDLKDELGKAEKLAKRGLSDNYFLFTNARLTGAAEAEMREAFLKVPDIKQFVAFGVDRISQIIRESPRLRMLVPRVYGLGDLSQILDERACAQAKEILSALGDDLGKFVITKPFQQSAKALVDHGFVLLLGEPACGKSTIAAALAVGALDVWGCSTFKIRNAEDFVAHSNPHEPKQFFWVDDAFGATQLDLSCSAAWNTVFPHMLAAIKRGARVLFTSRDYIYTAAKQHLKESSFPILRESQVIIHVEELSKAEREQILYNHIRLGNQPKQFKSHLKPFLCDVAANRHFSPEIARRLGDPLFTRRLHATKEGLDDFVARPVELLCDIIRTLDRGSKAALALIFMRGGTLVSPMELAGEETRALELMGSSIADVRTALGALNGSLVLLIPQDGKSYWRFKHPTIRDAFAAVIADDRELMDIYLAGAPVDRMFREVTCGDVGIQGARVIVPADRYGLIIDRLACDHSDANGGRGILNRFLAYRCDQEFLKQYLLRNPSFIAGLRVGSYLYAVSDVDVLVRLHEYGLLPEANRAAAVASIRELAIETPDAGFLRDEIRAVLLPDEFKAIVDDLRKILLPKLGSIIRNWRHNYDSGVDPEDYFSELTGTLEEFKVALNTEPEAVEQIDAAISRIGGEIEEIRLDAPPEPDYDYDDYRERSTASASAGGERSIFDDIDQ